MKPIVLYLLISLLPASFLLAQTDRGKAVELTVQGLEKVSADSLEQAAILFSRAVQADTTYHQARLHKANTHYSMQEFQQAYDEYVYLLNNGYTQPEVYIRIGNIYNGAGRKEDAVRYYTEAIRLDDRQGSYYAQRGSVYLETGQYENAIQDLEKAIDLKYSDPALYSQLGFAWSRNNENRKAVMYLTKAIELDPLNMSNYAMRGFSLLESGQYQAAEQDYLHYLKKDSMDLAALYNIGRAQYGMGHYNDAAMNFNKVLNINPEYFDTWFRLGLVYAEQKDFTMADHAFSKAISRSPEDGYLYYNRAVARYRMKSPDFCRDLKTSISLGYKEAQKMADQLCQE